MDASQLQARGVYEAKAPLGTVLQDLDQIGRILEEVNALRKRIRGFAGFSLLAALLCAVASKVLSIPVLDFCAFFAFTFCVVLFIYSFVYGRKLYKHRDRLDLTKGLFRTLLRDADARSPFSARLALASEPKLVSEEAWLEGRNGKQKLFEEDFLSVEGELLDGTELSETVTELTRQRTHTNNNGKTKTKTRRRYQVTLGFAYPPDVYGDARPASTALQEEIKVPSTATLRNARVTEKAIVVKALVILKRDIVQTSEMLGLGAYRILNLSRRMAAGGASGTP